MNEKSIIEGENTVNIKLVEPKFKIGQTVYIPQRNGVTVTKITEYSAMLVSDNDKGLICMVTHYHVTLFLWFVSGLSNIVKGYNIFADKAEAKKVSRFLEVKADEKTWKQAISSNGDLKPCCANISEAREMLQFCKERGGLTVHESGFLKLLLFGSHPDMSVGKCLGIILKQLELC